MAHNMLLLGEQNLSVENLPSKLARPCHRLEDLLRFFLA